MRADQPATRMSPFVGAILPERVPVLDVAPGFDARTCERAVELLDKLRRSEIVPYGTESRASSTSGGAPSTLLSDDLKNVYNGPWVLTAMRAYGTTALAASASGAVPGNLQLRIIDSDRAKPLSKTAPLLGGLFALDSNTWELERPHVVGPAASIFVQVENTGGAGTGLWLSMLGEVVLGGKITAAEVREAIGLGLYPTMAWRSGLWSGGALSVLFTGDRPVCATEHGEQLRYELRARVAELRHKLATSIITPYNFFGRVEDVPQAGSRQVETAFMRNDGSHPILLVKMSFASIASEAASAVGAVFSNISVRVTLSGANKDDSDRWIHWRRVLLPVLADRSINAWIFDRPMVVPPDAALGVEVVEENVNATTDLYTMVHGFMVNGMSVDECREAISLGLLAAWRRSGD